MSFRRHVESNDYPIIVVDTETDGVIEKTAKAYGIGICFEDHEAFYIPIRKKDSTKWWSDSEEAKIIAWVVSLCKTKKLVGHNIIFDVLIFLYNWNVDLTDYVYSDTILQKHSVDEERPFALKEVAVKYLGAWADKAQEALYENIEKNGGKTTKASMQMFMADTDVLGEYCGYDTILTRMLFDIFEKKLSEENLTDLFYKEEIMPLYREVTIPMKKRGFNVDVAYFKKLEADISKDMVQLLKDINFDLAGVVVELEKAHLDKTYLVKRAGNFAKIYADFIGMTLPTGKTGKPSLAAAGLSKIVAETYDQQKFLLWIKNEAEINEAVADRVKRAWFFQQNEGVTTVFNISSNNHLKWLFFTKLKEEPLSKTETGDPQVDDDFLDSMKNKYSWVSKLSDYRKLLKLKSTYIESILEKQIDAVIYSTFIQFGPPSGRYASKSLNLQNIPRVKEEDSGLSEIVLRYGNAIKEGFISPEGYKIVNADYSQLEPRAFAEACGDVKLQQVYLDNEDLYGSIAKNIWKLDCTANEVKKKHPELRQKAKCFVSGTKVDTSEGVKSIEDVRVGDFVQTSFGYKKVVALTERVSKVGIFATNRGFLGCTPDHKIWNTSKSCFEEASKFINREGVKVKQSSDNKQELQKLSVYSSASLKNGQNKPYTYLEFDENWAYILGAFLGDGVGSYTNIERNSKRGHNSHLISSYVGICGLSEDKVTNKWVSLVEAYGWKSSKRLEKRAEYKPIDVFNFYSTEFTNLFQSTFKAFKVSEDTKKGRKNLQIQGFVFNSPLQVKLSFIAGLLDTDGYLKYSAAKKTSDIAIASKDFQLISDLYKLLSDIGIETVTRLDWNKTYSRYYFLLIFTKKGIKAAAELGLSNYLVCDRKKEAVESMRNSTLRANPNQKHPPEFKQFIEAQEERLVYDITVEGVHEFYASNIRVHNCVALAVVYGAESGRISKLLNISYDEAQTIIDDYLDAYPGLKSYMGECNRMVCSQGFVQTKFGRIRHLPEAKRLYESYGKKLLDKRWAKQKGLEELAWKFKSMLNLSKNFRIQGVAAYVVNKAAIAMSVKFKELGIDAQIVAQVHDELTCIAREDQAEQVKAIMKDCMENTTKLSVPLIAEPLIASNWAEAK